MSGSGSGLVALRTSWPADVAFWVLVASVVLGGAAAVGMLVAPSGLPEQWGRADGADALVRAWGVTWLALSAALLVLLAGAYRRGERAARWVVLAVPGLWTAHAVLAPGTWWNVALAAGTGVAWAVGLRVSVRGSDDPSTGP